MKKLKTNVIFNNYNIETEQGVPESVTDLTGGQELINQIADKQDKLTAGNNIDITDNEISVETLNERSNSETAIYGAKYINENLAPITYVNNLYASKTGTNTASLVADIPTPNNANTLTSTTTNIDYDWTTPEFTFTRELGVDTILTETNSFDLNLKFQISRNATLSFGIKIKVSTDNGSTWNYISSNQTTSSNDWLTGVGNTIDMVVYTDLLTEPTTYQAGTLFAIEVYKKQQHSNSLTTTIYCGVLVDGANIYTYVKFNFTNVNINTNQISDGAVTYSKLSNEVKELINSKAEIGIARLG